MTVEQAKAMFPSSPAFMFEPWGKYSIGDRVTVKIENRPTRSRQATGRIVKFFPFPYRNGAWFAFVTGDGSLFPGWHDLDDVVSHTPKALER